MKDKIKKYLLNVHYDMVRFATENSRAYFIALGIGFIVGASILLYMHVVLQLPLFGNGMIYMPDGRPIGYVVHSEKSDIWNSYIPYGEYSTREQAINALEMHDISMRENNKN